jgi:hypothetical protein
MQTPQASLSYVSAFRTELFCRRLESLDTCGLKGSENLQRIAPYSRPGSCPIECFVRQRIQRCMFTELRKLWDS